MGEKRLVERGVVNDVERLRPDGGASSEGGGRESQKELRWIP